MRGWPTTHHVLRSPDVRVEQAVEDHDAARVRVLVDGADLDLSWDADTCNFYSFRNLSLQTFKKNRHLLTYYQQSFTTDREGLRAAVEVEADEPRARERPGRAVCERA